MLLHLYCSYSIGFFFSNSPKEIPSKHTKLAAGHFPLCFHHCSILHCISPAAETMHLDLHTLINMPFPAGKGQYQLTFPSYRSASASNNNTASQRELITPQWHLCARCSHEDARLWNASIKPAKQKQTQEIRQVDRHIWSSGIIQSSVRILQNAKIYKYITICLHTAAFTGLTKNWETYPIQAWNMYFLLSIKTTAKTEWSTTIGSWEFFIVIIFSQL